MARPSKYKPEYAEQAKHLCKLGAITADLAEAFGVSSKTIETWMKDYPEFLRTVKETKQSANEQVAQSLFKRANGCSVPDSDVRVIDGKIVVTEFRKHFPPETSACMAWLHNRDSDNFKPRKAAEENTSDSTALIDALSDIASKL